MRIVAFSDTHGHHRKVDVPDGDVLVFAGDFMTCGYKISEMVSFSEWFSSLPHKNKIWVAGNHDRILEIYGTAFTETRFHGCDYLRDSEVVYEGVKFYGSPVTPAFNNWAFNVDRGDAIKKYWDSIPDDTDVLITHGPPMGTLDTSIEWGPGLGCDDLRKRVENLKLKAHVFGHIHGGYGVEGISHNVSVCNEAYRPVNAPQIIDL